VIAQQVSISISKLDALQRLSESACSVARNTSIQSTPAVACQLHALPR
jgi:hypothetical protein